MPFSTYLDNAILNEIFGKTDFIAPTTLYVGLSTTAPTKAGAYTEPSGNAYARVAVANNTTNFPNASASSKNNGTVITFPEATGAWGTPSHWFVADAASAGNLLVYGAINAPLKAFDVGDTPTFAVNGLSVSIA